MKKNERKRLREALRQQKFSEQKRNAKLLVLSIGILIACIAATVIVRGNNAAPVNAPANVAAPTIDGGEAVFEPEESPESSVDAPADSLDGMATAPVSPEERENALEDMQEQIPAGQIIVY